jgi:hypothetical protein
MPKGRALRRQTTATIGQTIRTTPALTSRPSERNVIPRPTTTTAAIHNSALTIRRQRARTRRRKLIPRRAAATQLRQGRTPHPAAAIAAVAAAVTAVAAALVAAMAVVEVATVAVVEAVEAPTVVEVATVAVVEAVEAPTVVEAVVARAVVEAAEARTAAAAPALTRANLFVKTIARPDLPDGLFVFRHRVELKFSSLASPEFPGVSGIARRTTLRPAGC